MNYYFKETFPLSPKLTVRQADEYNTKNFGFQWLFLKLWSLDSLSFEISFVLDSHWGIGFVGTLPYLRWVVAIPFPEKFNSWVQRNLWRKTKHEIDSELSKQN